MSVLPAVLSYWCSDHHILLVLGGRRFKPHPGKKITDKAFKTFLIKLLKIFNKTLAFLYLVKNYNFN